MYNKSLENLYDSKWELLRDAILSFNEEDPEDFDNLASHPLLLKIDEEYKNSDLKIMFFGKETNTWCLEYNDGVFGDDVDIKSILSIYEKFYLNKGYESYGKQFWNYIKQLKSKSNYNELMKIGFVWNNVLKIGKVSSGIPQHGLLDYTIKYFNIIPQEIEILKPNLLIFLCGPGYDNYIRNRVGEFTYSKIEDFTLNEFCILKFRDMKDILAIRTYHPRYLNYKTELRKKIFETKIKLINEFLSTKTKY